MQQFFLIGSQLDRGFHHHPAQQIAGRTTTNLLDQFQASLDEKHTHHSPKASSWIDGVKSFVEKIKF